MKFVPYAASTLAGLILFGLGIIGQYHIPAQPIDALTVLLEPTSFGVKFDDFYYFVLSAVGIWLVLYVLPRAASGIALVLVLSKMALIKGWIPVGTTVALCLLLTLIISLHRTPRRTAPQK